VVKTKAMLRAEKRLGKPLEQILPETYEKFGNCDAAGKSLSLNPNTLYVWLIRLGFTITKKPVLTKQLEVKEG